jgi:superfamily II DNA or RNA helicase
MIDSQTVNEVVSTVREQGEVTKNQILETWDTAEEDYAELQKQVLQSDPSIAKGPKGIGGFVLEKPTGRPPTESTSEALLLRTDLEKSAVERLTKLLTHSKLEDLLGTLLQTVRQVRLVNTGVDRRGTKSELATALVLKHGVDLFCVPNIRKAVGKAVRIASPSRWHPGKQAAIEFVASTGFPRELAGLPTEEGLPDFEYLEGRFRLRLLEPFQREVKAELGDTLQEAGRRAIVTLPTGAGKTRVAVESIRDWLTKRYDGAVQALAGGVVLWLAHTEELCEQACTCFKQVWEGSESVCPLLLIRFWGHYTQDLAKHRQTMEQILTRPGVLVSTPQRIINLLDQRIEGSDAVLADLTRALGLLVIDEAHRAAAPSYQRIIGDLIPEDRPVSVVGLTATPFRMEYVGDDPEEGTRELKEIFHHLIEPRQTLGAEPRVKLQDMGVLARPELRTIKTPTTMQLPGVPAGGMLSEDELGRLDRILAVRTDNTPRRLAILKELLPLAQDPAHSILYFGPTVRDAECMAYLLRRERIPSAVVSSGTRDVTRRQIVAEFKQKRIRVLCNCEVLTTGFDAPQITHIVVARPTVSRVLYEQIVGRGLRGPKFGGTATCVIFNCEDNYTGEPPPLGYECFRQVWLGSSTARQPSNRSCAAEAFTSAPWGTEKPLNEESRLLLASAGASCSAT